MSKKRNNPPEIAIALNYDQQNAPTVSATGQDELAEQIIALAEEHGIPLHSDPELAALLSRIPLGDEIPEGLYHAVAEVISFAYLLTGKFPPGFPGGEKSER
ncbi:MAG: EscU/YscU/HrcU family type III secretion system export apparatus switch protein [Candidatus Polarisedimenticolaceae bacterium]|nr:EscU/YscU/HrcU family type III secretion system export apparatus switch protein [Candidatus Polarisedimenticolaceae bacterium]